MAREDRDKRRWEDDPSQAQRGASAPDEAEDGPEDEADDESGRQSRRSRRDETGEADEVMRASKFGREVKIGLAVILSLVVVFAAVLYSRWVGWGEQSAAGDSAKPKAGQQQAGAAQAPAAGQLNPPAQPTVVAAQAGPALPGVSSGLGSGQWSVADDGGSSTAGSPAPAPPSFMPPAPAPAAVGDRYAGYASTQPAESAPRYGTDQGAADPAGTWQTGPGSAAVVADPPPPASPPGYGQDPGALQSSEPAASSQNPLRTDVAVQEPAASAPLAPRYPPSEPRLASPLPAYSPAAAAPVPSAGGGTWGAAPPASPMGTAAAGGKAGTYVVQPNDTFWSIAQQVYGSGTYYQALAEYNRRRVADPNRLRLGEAIATPALADLEKAFPELCPNPTHRPVTDRLLSGGGPSPMGGGRVYVVQEGDNLYEIARYELGKAARWVEIYDLNRDQLGNQSEFLAPGMKLLLPGDAAPDAAVTQRPGARYQR